MTISIKHPTPTPISSEAAAALLSQAESVVCWNGPEPSAPLLARLSSLARGPILMAAGMQGAWTAFFWWLGLIALIAIIVLGLGSTLEISTKANRTEVFNVIAILVSACFIFTSPSRLMSAHLRADSAHKLADAYPKLLRMTPLELDGVDRMLAFSEKIYGRRLTALWLGPATLWATGAYLLRTGLISTDGKLLGYGGAAMIFALLLAGCVTAYARGIWSVFGLATSAVELRRQSFGQNEPDNGSFTKERRSIWLRRSRHP